ncbi:hypothetical protein JIR001_24160 [Polycladomyces abyssicola]|jgi:hypothetical protein|uniref:Asparagine synthase n=1 Tax=Polycladomyces abyssicola TaxID=1125966 RepID=A0A8D5UH49_9BACL|nr:hypothetical protein [Polycladomyces abyssicola]BCU82633.1 hypothetical protein JIR001_24160 [Polycladomyces abyssicola]
MRKGLIPVMLGTLVSTLGVSLINRKRKNWFRKTRSTRPYGWGVFGFGLAHILLGGIDLFRRRAR